MSTKKAGKVAQPVVIAGGYPSTRQYAKRLLRQFRSGEAKASNLFEQHHPRFDDVRVEPKLADAQLVVARMFGYPSWPKYQHHHAELERCRAEIESGAPAPDGELSTVHIRRGSDIRPALSSAGYLGTFLECIRSHSQGRPRSPRWRGH